MPVNSIWFIVQLNSGISVLYFLFCFGGDLFYILVYFQKLLILLPQTLNWWDYSCTFLCGIFGIFLVWILHVIYRVIVKLPTFITICPVSLIISNSVCFTKLMLLTAFWHRAFGIINIRWPHKDHRYDDSFDLMRN